MYSTLHAHLMVLTMAIFTVSTLEGLDGITQAKHQVLAKLPSSQPTYTILTLPGLVEVLQFVSYTSLWMTQNPTCPKHLDIPGPSWCHAAFIPAQKSECDRLLLTHIVPTFSDGLALVKQWTWAQPSEWARPPPNDTFPICAGLAQVTQPEHQLSLANVSALACLCHPDTLRHKWSHTTHTYQRHLVNASDPCMYLTL